MQIVTFKKGPITIFLVFLVLFSILSFYTFEPKLRKLFPRSVFTGEKLDDESAGPIVKIVKNKQQITPHANNEQLRPGDKGYPVKLTVEEEEKAKKLWHLNEFNMVAAAKVPLDRTLPDFRHSSCLEMKYPLDSLPKTSIIVIFHNEEYHTVLRTATSCFNRSPEHLLHEIILVDDFSDRDDVKAPLTDYVNSHFDGKVKVVRTPSRHGLIRAKNFGSKHATGEALVFLDSHCECTTGWLPPLLNALRENPKTVVQPVIPGIDQQTLAFRHSERTLNAQGTFEWSLLFYWRSIPPHDQKLRKSPIDPIRSPTLAGGLFGLMREWWEHLGRYDDGMELWGGENLELSFKTWLCGGQVQYIPCSHVGHIYRGKHPYHWYKPGPDRAFTTNARRLAEVWLDEYKKFFYEIAPDAKTLDMGSLEEQLANKKRLNCKPFKFFITDVVKDMYPPTLLSFTNGGLSPSKNPTLCLDTYAKKSGDIKLYGCHHQGGNQAISLTEKGELRINILTCLESVSKDTGVYMTDCNGNKNQFWSHEGPDSSILHKTTGQCLTFEADNKLRVADCNKTDENQKWKFDTYFEKPQ